MRVARWQLRKSTNYNKGAGVLTLTLQRGLSGTLAKTTGELQ